MGGVGFDGGLRTNRAKGIKMSWGWARSKAWRGSMT